MRGWGQGRNNGARSGILDQALQNVRAVQPSTGLKVSLVGWSLGGLYARELQNGARGSARGGHARQPVHRLAQGRGANARRTYEWLQRDRPQSAHWHEDLRTPPPVPTASWPGNAVWKRRAPMAENIEMQLSHVGLGVNPLA